MPGFWSRPSLVMPLYFFRETKGAFEVQTVQVEIIEKGVETAFIKILNVHFKNHPIVSQCSLWSLLRWAWRMKQKSKFPRPGRRTRTRRLTTNTTTTATANTSLKAGRKGQVEGGNASRALFPPLHSWYVPRPQGGHCRHRKKKALMAFLVPLARCCSF